MLRAIAFGFRNVLNLEGRDRRRVFLPYSLAVATIAVINFGILFVGLDAIFGNEPPPGGQMPASGFPMVVGIVANYLLMILLLFSACVRRLHDSGASMRSVVIGLGSLAIVLVSLPLLVLLIYSGGADDLPKWVPIAFFVCTLVFSVVANLGSLWMLCLLLRKGTPGANSYGPPPPKSLEQTRAAV